MGSRSWSIQRIYSKLPALAFDMAAIPLAWYLAYWLRFNMQPMPALLLTSSSVSALGILWVLQMVCYYHFKVYRGLWRFSSLSDVVRILRAVSCATIVVIPILYLFSILGHLPRSVLPLYSIILSTLLCGGRLFLRHYCDNRYQEGEDPLAQRALIIGAGLAGEGLVRDLKRTRSYLPVGLVDDDQTKRGLEVHGVPVVGTIEELPLLTKRYRVDLIFIAIPSARSVEMRRIVNRCEQCKIPFRTLPSIVALATGHVEVNALREVCIDDLLGRDQVMLHWEQIAETIQKKRVLVTGGGGSIGSELCRQIMSLEPLKLLVLDNSEFNLYKIESELRECFPQIDLDIALTSVVDKVGVDSIFQSFKPDIVFHAAAYKHVPLLEAQIRSAVLNNVIGTQIVAQASVAAMVSKFIFISSDKAVNPTNVMGATKRVAEMYCENLNPRVSTQFITVRFGNVLGSVGSVVPLFQKQLQQGGPITITHPDMCRYFMTIPEASQLILQAMVDGMGGEIFVLDMGEPIKITYLAEQMIRLAGKEPGKDIHLHYIGLRPGEKLFEELFHASEELVPTKHEKLFKARFRQLNWHQLSEVLYQIQEACRLHQHESVVALLKKLVPEFRSQAIASIENKQQMGSSEIMYKNVASTASVE